MRLVRGRKPQTQEPVEIAAQLEAVVIGRVFALEESWSAEAPQTRHRLRNAHLHPHLEAFFSWAEGQYASVRDERGLLRSALGYAVRQKAALMRLLDDGRLVLDNNRSERALRRIAVGRKAWLFVGSDGHAQSAGNILSLVASARLHGLDPKPTCETSSACSPTGPGRATWNSPRATGPAPVLASTATLAKEAGVSADRIRALLEGHTDLR